MSHDLSTFAANPLRFVEQRALGQAAPVAIHLAEQPALLLARPSAIRHVLVEGRERYTKGEEQAKMRSLLGEGLVTATDARWEASRQALKSGFGAAGLGEGLRLAMATLGRETGRLATQVGQTIDVHQLAGRLAMRMATAALFHERLEDHEADLVYEACATAHHWLSDVMWGLGDPDSLEARAYDRAVQNIHGVVERLSQNPKGVLAMLQPVVDQYGRQALFDEALTMLVAGFETTATAAAYLLYALADKPEWVEWIRAEADQVVNDEGSLDPARLREMPRTRALVQEVLRLYPSAWWFARQALEDDVIDGVPVTKGQSVLICPWVLHRQRDLWPDPERFDPTRFLDAPERDKFAHLPFGAGPRTCIGAHLATAELAGLAAMVASSFDLMPMSGSLEQVRPTGGITLGPPVAGMRVRVGIRAPLRRAA